MEGEEWKHRQPMNEWNSQEKIALDEYGSIAGAFESTFLVPIIYGRKLDRAGLSVAKSDLTWKLANRQFSRLSEETREAYQRLMNFVQTLESTSDEEISSLGRQFFDSLRSTFIGCKVYGDGLQKPNSIYSGRNPCREHQYKLVSAIAQAETPSANKTLIDAARGIYDTCLMCPFRAQAQRLEKELKEE